AIVIEHTSAETSQVVQRNLDVPEGSLAATRAFERIKPFVGCRTNVVMEGEPGSGKRFHASLLHAQGARNGGGEFVEVRPETPHEVLRAILFDDDRRLLERKQGGRLPSLPGRSTLYLCDVTDFSIINQTSLSRFLIQQERGHPPPRTRLIASSALPWGDAMRGRLLVESLAQSMKSFAICHIPPLRERFDELPSLIQEFLVDLRKRESIDCWRVKEEALQQLKLRSWRDNILELKYVVEDAAVNSSDGTLKLPARPGDEIDLVWEMFRTIQKGKRLAIEDSLAALEKAVIERALVKNGFDQRKTARMLSMTEPNLTYRIKKFNIYLPMQGK
ncbi:MAG: helix-turn-helix domain-containing protein, partial [Bacteroidota bacterium]